MNPRMLISMAAATMSLVFAIGCSTAAKKKSTPATTNKVAKTEVSVPANPNDHYTSLAFGKGETRLSGEDKRHLQDLADKVRESGKEIDDIKILTWADQEYKDRNEAPNSQIILARQRAESIKNYLQEDLRTDADIDYYNMAQKPGPLSRFFKTKESEVHKKFEANKDYNMLGDTRASKGLVIIEYEDGTKTNL